MSRRLCTRLSVSFKLEERRRSRELGLSPVPQRDTVDKEEGQCWLQEVEMSCFTGQASMEVLRLYLPK